ncbi:MAG: bifunctional 4-hydroxy-2-oxoglutarate aldolase/2-dehydro-3-deoxy-phosphogluconate aldolase [Treponema sp.]|nr:bifunctional 4-hydroxy-2-oxoglutarate aldolase/2-dehydro-3-deoxy-phosphogluconate aldolase [Treponema sp.]
MDTLAMIKNTKLVAIARRVAVADIVKTAQALHDGGIQCLEITFDQSSSSCIQDTATSIQNVKTALGDVMSVGAGTVLTVEQARAAAAAGADFALAPSTDVTVIAEMKRLGLTAIPGALTPTEIMTAWNAGADIVKVFPADILGVAYIKAIRGPISHVPCMAVGGVTIDNVRTFLENGYCSCGIGSNVVRNDLIKAGNYAELTALAKAFVAQKPC